MVTSVEMFFTSSVSCGLRRRGAEGRGDERVRPRRRRPSGSRRPAGRRPPARPRSTRRPGGRSPTTDSDDQRDHRGDHGHPQRRRRRLLPLRGRRAAARALRHRRRLHGPAAGRRRDASKLGTATPATPHMRQFPADGTSLSTATTTTTTASRAARRCRSRRRGGQGDHRRAHARAERHRRRPPLPHMRAAPAEGTFLNAAGATYRVAGGAAVQLANCAVLGQLPRRRGGRAGHDQRPRRRAPARHAQGRHGPARLPSQHALGEDMPAACAGRRSSTSRAIGIDDHAIGLIPRPQPCRPWSRRRRRRSTRSSPARTRSAAGARVSAALSVRDVPAGSKVSVHCSSRTLRPAYRSQSYTVAASAACSASSRLRRPRAGVTLSVKIGHRRPARGQADGLQDALEQGLPSARSSARRRRQSLASADVYFSVEGKGTVPFRLR